MSMSVFSVLKSYAPGALALGVGLLAACARPGGLDETNAPGSPYSRPRAKEEVHQVVVARGGRFESADGLFRVVVEPFTFDRDVALSIRSPLQLDASPFPEDVGVTKVYVVEIEPAEARVEEGRALGIEFVMTQEAYDEHALGLVLAYRPAGDERFDVTTYPVYDAEKTTLSATASGWGEFALVNKYRFTECACNATSACDEGCGYCDLDCFASTTCTESQWRCGSGACIEAALECDGVRHCPDGTDEDLHCNPDVPTCAAGQFACSDGTCINSWYQCDGSSDCEDGSDESAGCDGNECREDQFQCGTGYCVPESYRCDGYPDCTDYSDEGAQCNGGLPVLCELDEYRCQNGQCVYRSYVCDGYSDCYDGSDEGATCNDPARSGALGFCNEAGWCLQNPLSPLGGLNAIWGADGQHVWAVGARGTILFYDGTKWRPQASHTASDLFGIFGLNAETVWAVGAAGTALRRENGEWKVLAPSGSETLRAVWAQAADQVWAAGDDNALLRWDGIAWWRAAVPQNPSSWDNTTDFKALWGASGQIWVAGSYGGVFKLADGTWSLQAAGLTTYEDATAIWGLGTNQIYLGTSGGRVLALRNGQFQEAHDGYDAVTGFFGTSASDVWAVAGSRVLKFDGSAWWELAVGSDHQSAAIWGDAPGAFWVVGESQNMGFVWRRTASAATFQGSSGAHLVRVVAVGEEVHALSQDGQVLSKASGWRGSPLFDVNGNSIVALAEDDIWACGNKGLLAHYDGAAWQTYTLGDKDWYSLSATSPDNVWAVGQDGAVARWNGQQWSLMDSPVSTSLGAVWATSATDAWVVGSVGVVGRYVGGVYEAVEIAGDGTYMDGSMDSAGRFWLVSIFGTVKRWADGAFETLPSPPVDYPFRLRAGQDGQMWVGHLDQSQPGTLALWDGGAWSVVETGVQAQLVDVAQDVDGGLWAVGYYGHVVYKPAE